jgi:hypothetical protein
VCVRAKFHMCAFYAIRHKMATSHSCNLSIFHLYFKEK